MRRIAATTFALALLGAAPLAAQEQPETGAFIVRLGVDTVAVERYARHADRLAVVRVSRTPRTAVRRYVLHWGADGAVTRFEALGAPGAPAENATVTTFQGDSATIEGVRDGERFVRREALQPAALALRYDLFSLYEQMILQGLRGGEQAAGIPGYLADPAFAVRRVGADSATLTLPVEGTVRARIDGRGRVLGLHAGALNTTAERAPRLDVDALAREFAARDEQGRGLGILSPRDTARATVHGAQLSVDYSRPSRRGREIFGGLVPWNQVWRTGANQATQLITDRDLVIGDVAVPAGTYSVFTIPAPGRWTLILNRQTNQSGTAYDAAQDLARIEIPSREIPETVEQFTIAIEERGEGGVLRFLWERTEASVPFRVAGAPTQQ